MKLSSQLPFLFMNAVGFCVTGTFSDAHVRRPPVAHWFPSCRPFCARSSTIWAGHLSGLCPKDMPMDILAPTNPDSGKSGEPDS